MNIFWSVYLAIGAILMTAVLLADYRAGWLSFGEWRSATFWVKLSAYPMCGLLWPGVLLHAWLTRAKPL